MSDPSGFWFVDMMNRLGYWCEKLDSYLLNGVKYLGNNPKKILVTVKFKTGCAIDLTNLDPAIKLSEPENFESFCVLPISKIKDLAMLDCIKKIEFESFSLYK